MSYAVKEIFYTLQGEGTNTGRPAVFCRFAGCNLWTGYEKDRAMAVCNFCDTDFVGTDGPGGGKILGVIMLGVTFTAALAVRRSPEEMGLWPNGGKSNRDPNKVFSSESHS